MSASLLWPQRKPKRSGVENCFVYLWGCILTTKLKVLRHVSGHWIRPAWGYTCNLCQPCKGEAACKAPVGKGPLQPLEQSSPQAAPGHMFGRLTLGLSQKRAGDHLNGLGTILWIVSCINIAFFKPLWSVSQRCNGSPTFLGGVWYCPSWEDFMAFGSTQVHSFQVENYSVFVVFSVLFVDFKLRLATKCNLKRRRRHTFHVIAWYSPAISPRVAVVESDWFNIQYWLKRLTPKTLTSFSTHLLLHCLFLHLLSLLWSWQKNMEKNSLNYCLQKISYYC